MADAELSDRSGRHQKLEIALGTTMRIAIVTSRSVVSSIAPPASRGAHTNAEMSKMLTRSIEVDVRKGCILHCFQSVN
jgi:hypothetical protein